MLRQPAKSDATNRGVVDCCYYFCPIHSVFFSIPFVFACVPWEGFEGWFNSADTLGASSNEAEMLSQ